MRRLLAAVIAFAACTAAIASDTQSTAEVSRAQDHVTAPTRFVEADGVRYAYRRFGGGDGDALPLVFLQHFRGGLDHWDPAVTDALAAGREVILFDNAGVGASGGTTPDTIAGMAEHLARFLDALALRQIDLLGFSMGGTVAQAFVLAQPDRVRRLVLVGTAPAGGEGLGLRGAVLEAATRPENTREDFLFLFFEPSESSQAAGRAFWERRHRRRVDVDPPTSAESIQAMGRASADWAQVRGERYADLRRIRQPVLVVNGVRDIMVPTVNSYILQQHLPDATLILYPDSGHGALFQHADAFTRAVAEFLDR